MKKISILTILMLLFFLSVKSQIITTDPSIPLVSDSVTIVFDATLGTAGLEDYTGEVYAHTGVITDKSENDSDWKYVIADWGVNVAKARMTSKGNNKWELKLTPDIRAYYGVPEGEKILKMNFVFRSATQVDGAWLEGKDDGGKDIFVDVFEAGLNVSFNSPDDDISVGKDSLIKVNVSASSNDSIFLYVDNNLLKAVKSDTLLYDYTANVKGNHQFIARATEGEETVSDTITFFVRDTVTQMDIPEGMVDGINIVDDTTVCFVLFAPEKQNVFIKGDFTNWQISNDYQMYKDGDRFWLSVTHLEKEKEYIFQYLIDGDLTIADPYSEKVSDPWNDAEISSSIYPGLIVYPEGKTTEIASVFSTGRTDYSWEIEDFTPKAKEDLVIYEMLIRDFTEEGSIRAAMDKLDYLQELGINAVELMPFNEFEGNDSWGYNPSFYFAPDKAYGTINDYKEFIDECHKRGMAVIMDMVLNHSYGQSPLVRMYMDNGMPAENNPWYNQAHNFENTDAHWGYDINHESSHTQTLVDSICSYWMTYYNIDGFRFDFTKGFSNKWHPASGSDSWGSDYDLDRINLLKRMSNEIWERNPNAIVIFEHLAENSEEKVLAEHGILLWGNSNHNYNQASMGYLEDSDFNWASYKSRGWNAPNLVSYMESHDEERLMFKNINFGKKIGDYDIKELPTALERMELVNAFYLTIPGPKMIWQFGELGYDYSIEYNGRLGKKPVKWEYLDVPERHKLYLTIKAIIDLKTKEKAFNTTDYQLDVSTYFKHIQLKGNDTDICIVGNFDAQAGSVSPMFTQTGKWYDYFSGDSISISSVSEAIDLDAGEYRIYTTKRFETPDMYSAPEATDVEITGEVKEGKILTGTYTYYDKDGDQEGLSLYSWYRADTPSGANKQLIDGATANEYIPGRSDVSKYISFEITPVAATGVLLQGNSVTSPYVGPIDPALYVIGEEETGIRVYSNYTERMVHIKLNDKVDKIEIVSLLGKKVMQIEADGRRSIQLGMSSFDKGYYVINFVMKENKVVSKKIYIIK